MFDVAIIGCGVIGAATAYTLSHYDISIVMLEAENDVATGTSKANSAILHAGYDPEPGTQMARLNVQGVRMAKEICAKLDVPYAQIGSFVLAFSEEEMPHLQKLFANGNANGVPDLQLLTGEEARKLEPNLSESVVGALYAPSAAIVNPWEYTLAMAETAVRNGASLRLGARVMSIAQTSDGYAITTPQGIVGARFVVNAAGIHADEMHQMVAPRSFTTRPSRGEYYLLDKSEGTRVNRVIFQCPTKVGKGVLVAPTVDGNLIVGPNAHDVTGNNTANTAEGLAFVAEMAKKSVPGVDLRASIRNFAGVRAITEHEDFIIQVAAKGFVDLAGIKSPGLSAAPAIGEEAVRLLEQEGLKLRPQAEFTDTRRHVRFRHLSAEEKKALVQENAAYGRVICRCETITEGEILDAIHSPIPPVSIDGVKRRCGAGMGRCQGGFCGPRVLELLAREAKRSPVDIMQDKDGMYILTGITKQGGGAHV